MPERFPGPVAQPSNQDKLFSLNEKKPHYNKEKENKIFLSYNENNRGMDRGAQRELLSRFEKISGKSTNIIKVYLHFLSYGASFAKDLVKSLGLTTPTTYRILDQLSSQELILPVTKTSISRKGGQKTSIYCLPCATEGELKNAVTRDLQYSSKSYAFVDQLYQRTLVEVENEEIQYSKIIKLARHRGNKLGFHFTDVAEHVARKHAMEGVKVWR